jgi:hypothetical protein
LTSASGDIATISQLGTTVAATGVEVSQLEDQFAATTAEVDKIAAAMEAASSNALALGESWADSMLQQSAAALNATTALAGQALKESALQSAITSRKNASLEAKSAAEQAASAAKVELAAMAALIASIKAGQDSISAGVSGASGDTLRGSKSVGARDLGAVYAPMASYTPPPVTFPASASPVPAGAASVTLDAGSVAAIVEALGRARFAVDVSQVNQVVERGLSGVANRAGMGRSW